MITITPRHLHYIERLWRSVKYEEIYLKEHATLIALRAGLRDSFKRYNE